MTTTFYPTNAAAQTRLTTMGVVPAALDDDIDHSEPYVVVHMGRSKPTEHPTEVILWLDGPASKTGARVCHIENLSTLTEDVLKAAYLEACEDRAKAILLAQDAAALVQVVRRTKDATSRALIERATGEKDGLVHAQPIRTVRVGDDKFAGTQLQTGTDFVAKGVDADLVVEVIDLNTWTKHKRTGHIVLCTFIKSADKAIADLLQSGRLEYQPIEIGVLKNQAEVSKVILGVVNRLSYREDVVHREHIKPTLTEAQLAKDIADHVGNLELGK